MDLGEYLDRRNVVPDRVSPSVHLFLDRFSLARVRMLRFTIGRVAEVKYLQLIARHYTGSAPHASARQDAWDSMFFPRHGRRCTLHVRRALMHMWYNELPTTFAYTICSPTCWCANEVEDNQCACYRCEELRNYRKLDRAARVVQKWWSDALCEMDSTRFNKLIGASVLNLCQCEIDAIIG